MVTRFHYDDVMLRRLLADDLPERERLGIADHAETCPECQARLETFSEVGITWGDVRRFLGPTNANTPAFNERERTDDATIRRLNFLNESDDPKSLGRFGRFEIHQILGHGGMGIVMRGYDSALNRYSAVKVLAPHLASNASARRRFSREAKSAAAVVHEHVIPIHTVDEEDGTPYLVMPVVEGLSLEQRVGENGPLEMKEVLRIGMQTASGLAAAHAQGLVHRDVKPANILLANGVERVMITDFGLARAADDANMTQSGVIAGTPQYMSPEQARGTDIDHRSDLFSLGSVIYFMCTGRSPFRSETTMGVLHRIVNEQPRSLSTVNADVPSWLQAIVERLLAKDPDNRFQTAEEVRELLERWLAHMRQPSQVAPPERVEPRSPKKNSPLTGAASWGRRVTAIAVGCSLLLGVGAVVVQAIQDGKTGGQPGTAQATTPTTSKSDDSVLGSDVPANPAATAKQVPANPGAVAAVHDEVPTVPMKPSYELSPDAIEAMMNPLYELLPADIDAMVTTHDVSKFSEQWKNSSIRPLFSQPAFPSSFLYEQLRVVAAKKFGSIALSFRNGDIGSLFTGRIAFALLPANGLLPPVNEDSSVLRYSLVADIPRENYIAFVSRLLSEPKSPKRLLSNIVIADRILSKESIVYSDTYAAYIDGKLLASNDHDVLRSMIDRALGNGLVPSLANSADFKTSRRELSASEARNDRPACILSYFVRPLGIAATLHATSRTRVESRMNLITSMRQTGFEDVQNVVGEVSLADSGIFHDAFILAKHPLPGAAGSLNFPNKMTRETPSFISDTTTSVTALHWDIATAFPKLSDLVNDFVGTKGVFEEVVEGIRFDVNGPKIDIVNELLPLLTGDIFVVTECDQADVEHKVFAVKVNNEVAMWGIVDRAMRGEPDAKHVQVASQKVWTVSHKQVEGQPEPLLGNWALSIAGGYFLFTPSLEAMQHILAKIQLAEQSQLPLDPDYSRAARAIESQFGGLDRCAWQIQTSRSYRTMYESLRTGKMGVIPSVLSRFLNSLRDDVPAIVSNTNASFEVRLPPYSEISKYLPPSATIVETTPSGWHIRGALIDR